MYVLLKIAQFCVDFFSDVIRFHTNGESCYYVRSSFSSLNKQIITINII